MGRGLAAVLVGATGIGFAPILVRWSEVGPSATAGWRVLLALPLLWLWAGREPPPPALTLLRRRPRRRLWMGAAGLFFAVDLGLWHWSLQFTAVANSTLLLNLAPLFVTLGAALFFRERITPPFLLGLATALGGAALLLSSRVSLEPLHWRGDALAVGSAVFYAAYLLSVKRLRASLSTARVMAGSGVVMVPLAFLFAVMGGETLAPATGQGWAVLVALAVVSHVGGQVLIAYGLGHLPAAYSSVGLLWQPVVAALAGWALLAEALTLPQVLGGIGVLAGIAIATRRQRPAAVPPAILDSEETQNVPSQHGRQAEQQRRLGVD